MRAACMDKAGVGSNFVDENSEDQQEQPTARHAAQARSLIISVAWTQKSRGDLNWAHSNNCKFGQIEGTERRDFTIARHGRRKGTK